MAQSATSLGPKPSLFYLFLFFFLAFALREKPCFPPQKGIFVYFFCVSLCFSLAFIELLPFSISLSLSFSCSFLASFLSVLHFCSWFLLFLFVFVSLFQDVLLFLFYCVSASCLVLFRIIMLDFCFLCILFSGCCCCCFWFSLLCYVVVFVIFGNLSKTSLNKKEIGKKTTKSEKCRKKGHFDKSN